jgi:hypothetical protein
LSKDNKMGAPNNDKPYPDTEITDTPSKGVKGNSIATPLIKTRDKSNDETISLAEIVNS